MKRILSVVFLLIMFVGYSQQFYEKAELRMIKEFEKGYLSLISGAGHDPKLSEFLKGDSRYSYSWGISLHDIAGSIKWIYIDKNIGIQDFTMDKDKIRILGSKGLNSKAYSKDTLFELILNNQGNLISKTKLTSVADNAANARITAKYDDLGQIWSWTCFSFNDLVVIDGDTTYGFSHENYLVQCRKADNTILTSNIISGPDLEFRVMSNFENNTGLVFSGKSVYVDNKLLYEKAEGVYYLGFNESGRITSTYELGNGKLNIEFLELDKDGIYLSGTFQGNDNLKYFPSSNFQGRKLSSPKNGFREETARNVILAHLSYSFDLKWIKTIASDYDVMIQSMSVRGDSIAMTFEYKDHVKIDQTKISSLKDRSYYEYSDLCFCIFNKHGKLTKVEQSVDNGYANISVCLLNKYTVFFGNFLASMDIFDYKLRQNSIHSVNFIIFRKK